MLSASLGVSFRASATMVCMKKAPDFSLPDQNGTLHSLADYAGAWLVLYFYPKDDTPGCTAEACAFRDGRDVLAALGAEVVGISKDTVRKHTSFVQKHQLNFTLLSDTSTETIQAFGSWKLKKFMGREYMGINRDTYIINPEGYIAKKYEGVNVKTHFDEVSKDLQALVAAFSMHNRI